MVSKRTSVAIVGLGLLFAVGIWMLRVRGPVGHSDRVTLRFWHGFTSKDGETMLQIIRQFNRENPGIDVQVQRIPWSTYYNKLFVAGLAGRAPDVFVSHTIMLSRLARGGFVQPVDELVAQAPQLDVADIDPGVWQAVEHKGKHLGVPLDVHPIGLFYNRTLLRDAGVVDERGEAKPPRDWDEFVDALRRLNRDLDGDGRNDQWGFMFEGTPFIAVDTMMLQHGGRILSPDGTKAVLDSPENLAALRKARALTVDEKLVPPPGDETAWTSFLQGKVGMFLGGVFMVGGLERQSSIDYAAAPVPQFGPERGIWGDSHVICLPSQLAARERAAGWTFVKYLSDHSAEWAKGGQVPVRRSQRELAAFKRLPVQSVFARSVQDVRYLPNVPASSRVLRDVKFACDQVLRGAATPEEALKKAQADVEVTLARDRQMAAAILKHRAEDSR